MEKIFVLNSGSSSIKIKIFDQDLKIILEALIERIGLDGFMSVKWEGNKFEENYSFPTHKESLETFLNFLKEKEIIKDFDKEIKVIGHRVVMGSNIYHKPVLVNDEVIQTLKSISNLAPLHNPANILGVETMAKLVNKPNVLVFDTGFHNTIAEEQFLYPLPMYLYEKHKVRKYGMHGISYEYTVNTFKEKENITNPNLIIFHLGNGSSVAAIKEGKSILTSMGFTPLEGLMMGTRCGDIDPAIATFLGRELKMNFDEIDNLFNKQSGLLAMHGTSSDMRDIIAGMSKGEKRSTLTFNMFVDRLVKYYVQYLNLLENEIDGIIFTGGIGYNATLVIEEFVKKVKLSNLKLKSPLVNNRVGYEKISTEDSQFPIFISETNEELEIAKQSLKEIE